MSRSYVKVAAILALVLVFASTGQVTAKGGPPSGGETALNNLSFPVVAADQFAVTPYPATIPNPWLNTIYDGDPALDGTQAVYLDGLPCYAQKVVDNKWHAASISAASVGVYGVDWGDNVESVSPVVRRPYRLEIVLYDRLDTPLDAFRMTVLANPSSPDEIQGTNGQTFASDFATIVSTLPRLVVQDISACLDADLPLEWDATTSQWVCGDAVPATTDVGFAPELNVAGKYIFGASVGGWKPTKAGTYRVTFYIPSGSGIDLAGAVPGDLVDNVWTTSPWYVAPAAGAVDEEGGDSGAPVATPVIDGALNLTYVDLVVLPRTK
jgi:hypothetical protein